MLCRSSAALFAVLLASNARADGGDPVAPSPHAFELVDALLPRTEYENAVNRMVDATVESLKGSVRGESPEFTEYFSRYLEDVRHIVRDAMPSHDEMRSIIARHISRTSRDADLRATVTVARSAAGKTLMQSQSLMLQEMTALMAQKVRTAMPLIIEKAKSRARDPRDPRLLAAARLRDAAGEGDGNAVKTMLDSGVPIDAADALGNTALALATMKGHPAIARLLIDRGANVNARLRGYTTLMWASIRNDVELVRVLIAHGADPREQEAMFGLTAREMAERKHHDDVARLLREAEGERR